MPVLSCNPPVAYGGPFSSDRELAFRHRDHRARFPDESTRIESTQLPYSRLVRKVVDRSLSLQEKREPLRIHFVPFFYFLRSGLRKSKQETEDWRPSPLAMVAQFLRKSETNTQKACWFHSFPFLRDRRKARFVNHDNRDYGPGYHDLRTSCNLRNGDWAKRSVDME